MREDGDEDAGENEIDNEAGGSEEDVGPGEEAFKAELGAGERPFFEEFDGYPDNQEGGKGVDEGVTNGGPDRGGEEVATEDEVKTKGDGVLAGDDDGGDPD